MARFLEYLQLQSGWLAYPANPLRAHRMS